MSSRTIKIALVAALASLALAAPAAGQTVHLYGDSIHLGWGFGHYDHPSFLERIDLIGNVLAEANGSDLRFRRAGTQDVTAICADVRSGLVGPDDVVVFEDAGPRDPAAAGYRRWLESVAACVPEGRLVLGTMFDYGPNLPYSTYDTDAVDGLSINNVTRDVARAKGALLVDWNGLMDAARAELEPQEVTVVHPDGIHPTVFGNVLMAAALLEALGVELRDGTPVVWELVAWKWQIIVSLQDPEGMAPVYDREEADAWVSTLLRVAAGARQEASPAPGLVPDADGCFTLGRLRAC